MASLRRKARSPFWFACYTDTDGTRTQRSTKQTDRRKAQAVANQFEQAAKLGATKRLGEAQARKILAEIYEHVNNEPLTMATAREFLTRWPERKKAGIARATYNAYAQACRDFVASLGSKADRDIGQISRVDVIKFIEDVAKRTTVANANKLLKYLRVAMRAAWKDGLTQDLAAAKVDKLPERPEDRVDRRPFTIPELKKILSCASEEWKSIILFGAYTGQRLSDIGSLCWSNIDTEAAVIRLVTSKTGRRMEIPICAPLMQHIGGMPTPEDTGAPLFPGVYPLAIKDSTDSRLSQAFYDILVAAGMAQPRSKAETGKGRNRKRRVSEISFHSLRHTTTSMLKNAGASEAVVMDIIGHDSKAVSRIYTHIDNEAKRKAMASMPSLL